MPIATGTPMMFYSRVDISLTSPSAYSMRTIANLMSTTGVRMFDSEIDPTR